MQYAPNYARELRDKLRDIHEQVLKIDELTGDLQRLRPSRRVMPRQLRHFRFAPRIDFSDSAGGRRTRLSLVAPDRPGLLADVAQVLRSQHLRVHDARIATFGERAEDQFQITDEHDQPLPDPSRQALRDALAACLDPQ